MENILYGEQPLTVSVRRATLKVMGCHAILCSVYTFCVLLCVFFFYPHIYVFFRGVTISEGRAGMTPVLAMAIKNNKYVHFNKYINRPPFQLQ